MSMLAEKKRREKWSLNPRGKAWSEDQNKFGQRLMEKMGWKAGQGLGASSQGQTDIVKARVKNDSKGLGFKENGGEWLKTTSDFDNLLEELASGQEDSGEGNQTETPVSLEDRSKKSRARVHYHKFTRGKDISRYSEKDLASIIGPDVIKLKNEQESKCDYTQNQVNKGSLEEYFKKKLKSKDNKPGNDATNEDMKEDLKENSMDSNCENIKIVPETLVPVSPKKKKKDKIKTKENTAQIVDTEEFENCKDSLTSEMEVSVKSKKERKSDSFIENNSNDHEESASNGLDYVLSRSTKLKKELKNEMEEDELENPGHAASNADERTQKNKKRKAKREEIDQPEESNLNTINNPLIADSEVNEEVVPKKKRKKAKDENKEYGVDLKSDFNEECPSSNPVVSEETVTDEKIATKKKKKSKDKEYQCDAMEVQTDSNVVTDNNPITFEESVVTVELDRKNKRKSKDKNNEHQDVSAEMQTTVNVIDMKNNTVSSGETDDCITKKKKKKSKDKNKDHQRDNLEKNQSELKKNHKQDDGTNETTPPAEQVNNEIDNDIITSSAKRKKKHKKDKQQ